MLDRRTFTEVYLEGAIREIVDPAARTAVLTHISALDYGSDIFASRKIKTIRGSFANKQCLVFATNNGLVFGNSKMYLEIRHGRSSIFSHGLSCIVRYLAGIYVMFAALRRCYQ